MFTPSLHLFLLLALGFGLSGGLCSAQESPVRVIGFDPPHMQVGIWRGTSFNTDICEQGIKVSSQLSWLSIVNSLIPPGFRETGAPNNGTCYLSTSSPTSFSHIEGLPFTPHQVAVSGYSVINFVGYKSDGSTVTASFDPSGLNDGDGPNDDFKVCVFPSEFQQIVKLSVPNRERSYYLDNLHISVFGTENVRFDPPVPPLLHDLDWNSSLHPLDDFITVGCPGTPSNVKGYSFMARREIGGLRERPLDFTGEMTLNCAVQADRYTLDLDHVALASKHYFRVQLDADALQLFVEIKNSQITLYGPSVNFPRGYPTSPVSMEGVKHVRIDFDRTQKRVELSVNGLLVGSCTSPTALPDLRWITLSSNGRGSVGIDNIKVHVYPSSGLNSGPRTRNLGTTWTSVEKEDSQTRLYNSSQVPLTVQAPVLADGSVFSVGGTFPLTLLPDEEIYVPIRATPTQPGFFSEEIVFRSDQGYTGVGVSVTAVSGPDLSIPAGTFVGVIQSSDSAAIREGLFGLGGRFRLTVTDAGRVSGQISLNGKSYPVTGQISQGDFGLPSTTLALKQSWGFEYIVLVFPTRDSVVSISHAERTPDDVFAGARTLNPKLAKPFVGLYPTALRPYWLIYQLDRVSVLGETSGLSRGCGYLQLRVTATGVVSYAGKLGDGTAVAGSDPLVVDTEHPTRARMPLYLLSKTGYNSVRGWLDFDEEGNVDGYASWRGNRNLKDVDNPEGIDSHGLYPIGSRHQAPAPGTVLMDLDKQSHRLFQYVVNISPTYKMTPISVRLNEPYPQKITLAIQPKTSSFSGACITGHYLKIPLKASYSGVFVQRLGYGVGIFISQYDYGWTPTLQQPSLTTNSSPFDLNMRKSFPGLVSSQMVSSMPLSESLAIIEPYIPLNYNPYMPVGH